MENDFSRCEALIAGMLAKRTHWLPYLVGDAAAQLASRVRESLEVVVQGRLLRARQLFAAALLEEGFSIGAAAARYLEASGSPAGLWCELSARSGRRAGASPTLRQWQALAALALTQKGEWRRRLTVTEGFPLEDEALKRRGTEWLAELSAQRGVAEL